MFPDLQPFEYVEITVSSAAVALSVPVGAVFGVVRFENGPVRYRVDGGVPTTTVGLPAQDGDQLPIWHQSLSQFRAIRSGTDDGIVRVTFYRKR